MFGFFFSPSSFTELGAVSKINLFAAMLAFWIEIFRLCQKMYPERNETPAKIYFFSFHPLNIHFISFFFFLAATEAENPHSSSVSRLQEEPGSVRELPESQGPPDPPVISLVLERNFRKINLIHQRICN